MPKIKPFEEFSEEYDQWFAKNSAKYQTELNALKHLIPSGRVGLEVGVGSGKFAAPLGIKIGIDPSLKMVEKAKNLGIQVVLGVAENLPFKSQYFDYVLMVTTICFVDDLKKTFSEANRILQSEGFIVIGFIDKESELGKTYLRNRDKSHFYKIAKFYSAQEVLALLAETGFNNFEIRQTIFPGNNTQRIENGFGSGSFVVIKASKNT